MWNEKTVFSTKEKPRKTTCITSVVILRVQKPDSYEAALFYWGFVWLFTSLWFDQNACPSLVGVSCLYGLLHLTASFPKKRWRSSQVEASHFSFFWFQIYLVPLYRKSLRFLLNGVLVPPCWFLCWLRYSGLYNITALAGFLLRNTNRAFVIKSKDAWNVRAVTCVPEKLA